MIKEEVLLEVSLNNIRVYSLILPYEDVNTAAKVAGYIGDAIKDYPGHIVRILRTVSLTEVLGQGCGI